MALPNLVAWSRREPMDQPQGPSSIHPGARRSRCQSKTPVHPTDIQTCLTATHGMANHQYALRSLFLCAAKPREYSSACLVGIKHLGWAGGMQGKQEGAGEQSRLEEQMYGGDAGLSGI